MNIDILKSVIVNVTINCSSFIINYKKIYCYESSFFLVPRFCRLWITNGKSYAK